jgi:hypothetical protein
MALLTGIIVDQKSSLKTCSYIEAKNENTPLIINAVMINMACP